MPTIRIEALSNQNYDTQTLLVNCTEAVSAALAIPQNWVWAVFSPIELGCYAEGKTVWESDQVSQAPILISITALAGRSIELKSATLTVVAQAASEVTGMPLENVFVEYREITKGNAFSGGAIA